MTGREAATTARREQIIRTTIALLAERGYQATTFEAICRAAELSSKRLITYHFSSKDELFAAVAERVAADSETHVQAAIAGVDDARELLTTVIRANVMFIADHAPQMEALRQILLNGGMSDWRRYHVDSQDRLARLFAEGQDAGAFRRCDPRVMAAALRASIDSTAALISDGVDPRRCADELVTLFDLGTNPHHDRRTEDAHPTRRESP
ncbi:TetR family transcriptional regulator [Stackebrandtia albiflava]|uniref:TetR family transcriptional regulator n=1 Tax=Stackebrandtia albiflava TaxID=406432 RepID=A0A562V4R2_9ACTN|nr:TetR/AcrR family transcriptional regulator [Stackebrandtia albiflava]TWJ12808.1 TetR family transcriptional regulator [Stackebrandtia albiflava]